MDSPFKAILHTNTVPSDAECDAIHALLAGPLREVAELMDEINRTQALLDELMQKRSQLNKFIDAHLALVSPVRRLPEDVVREIFAASLPSNQNATMSRAESPLLLCRICRAWRSIALATPRLWTSLHIVVPSTSRLPQFTDAVIEWLSRSGSLPIAFSLVISYSAIVKDLSILLNALAHLSRRWKRIRFRIPSYATLLPLAALSEGDVPILQSASIALPVQSEDPTEWNSIGFIATPGLRSASVVCMGSSLLALPIHWQNLRHLNVTCGGAPQTLEAILQLLRKCTVLETCILHAPIFTDSPAAIQAPFRMENLLRLRVMDRRCTTETLFQPLVLPQLRSLEYICSMSKLSTLPFGSVFYSAEHLERLYIRQNSNFDSDTLGTNALAAALALVPMLQELHMMGEPMKQIVQPDGDPVDLVTMLTPGAAGAETILCPKLQHIKLERFRDVSDLTLLEFIQARAGPLLRGVTHLSSVDVRFERERQADIFQPLQDVIATGLKFSVVYDKPVQRLYSPSESLIQEDPEIW
ncbi:hypothetical protein B0H10DRAFT_2023225 [Mycena sp. CBHHK59/15]|nr:hypothetical protein B0H10DRAFT_2023225 [Mycena sp. CBHHK59/15]